MADHRTAEDVRQEAKAWFEEAWDADLSLAEWWQRLGESGWGTPSWPEQWFGKGLSADEVAAVNAVREELGAAPPPAGLSVMLAGPTLIAHGSDALKERFLRPIVTGEHAWCQLFSEPGAGSDLASLQCRAVQDGDEWVITGQKVWTSGAQVADLGMLLARTNPDVPKHKGITYFVIDMDQPGIEIRPLREMTGRALFNEVFFDEARVPSANIVGDLNEGWGVGLTTLANERVGLGGGSGASGLAPGRRAGLLERRAGDMVGGTGRRGAAAAMAGRSAKLLTGLAQAQGRTNDPHIRQQLAQLYTMAEISRYTQLRAKSAMAAGGRPGPEVSTGKLQISRMTRAARELGMQILGAHGMLAGADAPMNGVVQEMALFSPAVSIYGGSDEVQRNIIGERVLGLPKEPSTDKDVPFRDLKVGTQRSDGA